MKKMAKTPPKMKAPAKKSKPKEAEPVASALPELSRAEPHEHELEHAVRTLTEAQEIQKDDKMMPHVKKHIEKRQRSLSELKKLAHEKASKEGEESET